MQLYVYWYIPIDLSYPLKLYLQNLHYLVLFTMTVVVSIIHAEYYVLFENHIVRCLRVLQYNLKADYRLTFHILSKITV